MHVTVLTLSLVLIMLQVLMGRSGHKDEHIVHF
jgi:hypothetical protein